MKMDCVDTGKRLRRFNFFAGVNNFLTSFLLVCACVWTSWVKWICFTAYNTFMFIIICKYCEAWSSKSTCCCKTNTCVLLSFPPTLFLLAVPFVSCCFCVNAQVPDWFTYMGRSVWVRLCLSGVALWIFFFLLIPIFTLLPFFHQWKPGGNVCVCFSVCALRFIYFMVRNHSCEIM